MPLLATAPSRCAFRLNGRYFGENKIVWNDEFLCTEIGQVGTQFDGLAHIGVAMGHTGDQNTQMFYNGFTQK